METETIHLCRWLWQVIYTKDLYKWRVGTRTNLHEHLAQLDSQTHLHTFIYSKCPSNAEAKTVKANEKKRPWRRTWILDAPAPDYQYHSGALNIQEIIKMTKWQTRVRTHHKGKDYMDYMHILILRTCCSRNEAHLSHHTVRPSPLRLEAEEALSLRRNSHMESSYGSHRSDRILASPGPKCTAMHSWQLVALTMRQTVGLLPRDPDMSTNPHQRRETLGLRNFSRKKTFMNPKGSIDLLPKKVAPPWKHCSNTTRTSCTKKLSFYTLTRFTCPLIQPNHGIDILRMSQWQASPKWKRNQVSGIRVLEGSSNSKCVLRLPWASAGIPSPPEKWKQTFPWTQNGL